nr:MAG TPA: hypothetical protein [Siphoviridae sp. ct2ef27]
MPHEILRLPLEEQAFLFAAVSIKLKRDKDEAKKAKRHAGRRR